MFSLITKRKGTKNYGPVSLLSYWLKLLEKILYDRITDIITSKIAFPNHQLQGFQKDLRCIAATTINFNSLYHDSPVYVAFVDCKNKTYGTV